MAKFIKPILFGGAGALAGGLTGGIPGAIIGGGIGANIGAESEIGSKSRKFDKKQLKRQERLRKLDAIARALRTNSFGFSKTQLPPNLNTLRTVSGLGNVAASMGSFAMGNNPVANEQNMPANLYNKGIGSKKY